VAPVCTFGFVLFVPYLLIDKSKPFRDVSSPLFATTAPGVNLGYHTFVKLLLDGQHICARGKERPGAKWKEENKMLVVNLFFSHF